MSQQRQTPTEGMFMPAKPSASLFDAITSMKGAALLVPAILLVSATLAVGQAAAPSASAPPTPTNSPPPSPTGSPNSNASNSCCA